MICPKCKSCNTYFDGVDNACRTCGSRWQRTFTKAASLPATMLTQYEATENVSKKVMALVRKNKLKEQSMVSTNTIKTCRNCGRERPIIGDGLDSSCYWSVYKKFIKGTPEYDAALAKAKIKFSDPNYKRKSGKRPDKEISPDVKVLSIKHNDGDLLIMSGVIATMQMERERLLTKADKLAQAIKLLQ